MDEHEVDFFEAALLGDEVDRNSYQMVLEYRTRDFAEQQWLAHDRLHRVLVREVRAVRGGHHL